MKPQLIVCGRIDLDGTHKAVIETNFPEFESLLNANPSTCRFVKIQKTGRACGCILAEVKHGDANKIWLDRFKQGHLQIKDGDSVEVEEIQPLLAKKIELRVGSDFCERDIARLVGKPLTKSEKTVLYTFGGEPRLVAVGDVEPTGIVVIGSATTVVTAGSAGGEVPITYKDVGGLNREIKLIRELVEYPLRYPEVFERLGVSQPRGVILFGPPGTGKTLIARALANEVGAKFYSISGPEIFSMLYGESEKKLREIFDGAQKNAPSVILIDELDSLAPKRERTQGDLEQRIVATLLSLMDGLRQLKGVIVVGTTNRLNVIDSALRREGRFGHEIHVGVPDQKGRREILEIHTHRMPLSSDVNLDLIAERAVGFVGADLASLCREAAYNALRRSFSPDAFEKGQIVPQEELRISQSDFASALQNVPPSAIREFLVEIPKTSWEDIGGLDEVKRLLIENIAYAITKSEVFKKVGVKPARGILLYGPPGTGKTLLAKAVASQCGANFIAVKGPEIRSKWIGESEERIRLLFAKAREVAPCVIFFDEVDAITSHRGQESSGATDPMVNQILSEMDGIESTEGVYVIGATNRADLIDRALLTPRRFGCQIKVPLPDANARKAVFGVHVKRIPIGEDVNLEELVSSTDGFSGAEIEEACREAAWEAIRDAKFEVSQVKVTMAHLRKAVVNFRKRKDDFSKKGEPYVR